MGLSGMHFTKSGNGQGGESEVCGIGRQREARRDALFAELLERVKHIETMISGEFQHRPSFRVATGNPLDVPEHERLEQAERSRCEHAMARAVSSIPTEEL